MTPEQALQRQIVENPAIGIRELCNRRFYNFLEYFWPEISGDEFKPNWHIPYLCAELQVMAERVGQRLPREYDLLINVPPGTTKTAMVSIMFPAWCWTHWHWMRFITASYSSDLSSESAKYCRDLVASERFQQIYPEIRIDPFKNTINNFKIIKLVNGKVQRGGGRYSTSVGATMTGFHGHFLLPDDPLNPKQAASAADLKTCIDWTDQTLTTRRIDKQVAAMVLIQQRLHQGDPTGHLWDKRDQIRLKLICLPGEIRNYAAQLSPPELRDRYVDDLLDPVRMPWSVLEEEEARLGQYGFAAQYGQNPVPPGGGMFKVDHFQEILTMPPEVSITHTVRYWDKAGTKDGTGAFTVGVKMHRLANGKFIISDVKRGRWASEERERIIRTTAEADGAGVQIYHEQEPGPIWEEEMIQMADGSRKKLKDITPGDFVINMDGIPTKVQEAFEQGELASVEIKTDSGRSVAAALSHPFLTPKGWIVANDLLIGDVLGLKTGIKTIHKTEPTNEECRLAGYFVGDGCCTWQKNRPGTTCNSMIVSSDPSEGEDIVHCAESLGSNVHIGGSKGWSYYLSNGIRDWLKYRDLAGKSTDGKCVPEWILTADDEKVANFIGAFFACDGGVSVTKAHPAIEFYNTNLRLLEEIQSLLLRFGIYMMLRERNRRDTDHWKTRRRMFRLTSRRADDSMAKFAERIPVYGVKNKNLSIFKRVAFDQPILPDSIVEIKPVGNLPCRCLKVAEGESFLVSDIIVHNSGGKESAEATIRNLAGFASYADRPTGDKITRADPYSVQVNNGNVQLLRGDWNREFIEEHRFFPFGRFKDQCDAAAGAFAKLVGKKIAGPVLRRGK